MMTRRLTSLLMPIALACGSCAPSEEPRPLTVFAAASTSDALREAALRFEASTGVRVVLSTDASSRLARQIRAGAPADVYLSANPMWMDDLEQAGAIRAGTRHDLLANELVLIAPIGSELDADLGGPAPVVERLAVGDPAHVPAGWYTRQALESLNWWAALEPRLVPTFDVRAALRLVEIGEADAGIVYSTDAERSDRIEVITVFPTTLHEPIRYVVAACSDAPAGVEFIEFLAGAETRRIFEAAGFGVPGAQR